MDTHNDEVKTKKQPKSQMALLEDRAIAAGIPRIVARSFLADLDQKYLPKLESSKTTKEFAIQWGKLVAMIEQRKIDQEIQSQKEIPSVSTVDDFNPDPGNSIIK